MPISPKPFKYICSICGYSRVVKLDSDVLASTDIQKLNNICPKCKSKMYKKNLNIFDKLISI